MIMIPPNNVEDGLIIGGQTHTENADSSQIPFFDIIEEGRNENPQRWRQETAPIIRDITGTARSENIISLHSIEMV